MPTIEIQPSSPVHVEPEGRERVVIEKGDSASCYLVGQVRAADGQSKRIIHRLLEPRVATSAIHDCLIHLPGEYVIVLDGPDQVRVLPSYSHPQLYLIDSVATAERMILTADERMTRHNGVRADAFALRAIASQAFWIPRGIGADCSDFVPAGMEIRVDKESLGNEIGWVLPVHEIASRSNHEQAAANIADAFSAELASYKCESTEPLSLQLSSGLDSALLLAGAKSADLDLTAVNFKHPNATGVVGESVGARRMAKYFGTPFRHILRGPSTSEGDTPANLRLTDYLDWSKSLLKTATAQFAVDNASLLAAYNLGYHTSLEGSSFPTALAVKHYTEYPKGFRAKFSPRRQASEREKLAISHAEKLVSWLPRFDQWRLRDNWPEIHEYYRPYLTPAFTGSPASRDIDPKMLPTVSETGLSEYMYEGLLARGNEVIAKLLARGGLAEELKRPSSNTAIRLQKLLQFLNNPCFASSKLHAYRKAALMNEVRPGLSGGVVTELLKVRIDEKLVEYPKWHLFRAFEMLSGRSFWDINSATPALTALRRKILELRFGRRSAAQFRLKLLENSSLQKFIDENAIDDRYSSVLESLPAQARSVIAESTSAAQKTRLGAYWLLNSKLNLAFFSTE